MRVILPLVQPDLDGSAGWLAGLHYVRHCVRALLDAGAAPEARLVAVRHDRGPALLGPVEGEPVEERVLPRCEPGALLDLDALLGAASDDVVFPLSSLPGYVSSAAAVGWIPDFQHRHLPEFFPSQERVDRDRQQAFIVARSERLVCSSQAVRSDLLAAFPAAAAKADVVPFAVDAWADVDEHAAAPAAAGLPASFAYLPNQFWVHKNHALVLRAWHELARSGTRIPLVCTGAAGDHRRPDHYASLQARVDEWGLRDLVRFLGVVPRAEQLALYRSAAFVLQPSLFEGWSTSVEEARSLGRRVLASDIPVLREQAPEGTLFFDPRQAVALADRVRQAWAEAPSWPVDDARARAESRQRVADFGRSLARVLAIAAAAGRARQVDRAGLAEVSLRWRAELTVAEQDREARLRVIEQQGAELGRLEGLELAVADLERRLAVAEQDRAARLQVIEQQGAELGRSKGFEQQAADLERRLAVAEQDRAARLRVIEQQGAELGRLKGFEQQAADLERRLAVVGAELGRLAALLEALSPRPVLGLLWPREIRRLRDLLRDARTGRAAFEARSGKPAEEAETQP